MNKKYFQGFSLIEILVVVGIFAVLAVVATQATILSLGGAKKSENVIAVRENLEFAASVVERRVRNAKSMNCVGATVLNYVGQDNKNYSFTCASDYLEADGGRVTSDEIILTSCSFSCTDGDELKGIPPKVSVNFLGVSAVGADKEVSSASISTTVVLRTY